MRIRLGIDGIPHEIDSTDPELLARWIVEMFGRIQEITPATLIEFQAYPSWTYSGDGRWVPDWAADSAVIGHITRIRSPRELLDALGAQLDQLDQRATSGPGGAEAPAPPRAAGE